MNPVGFLMNHQSRHRFEGKIVNIATLIKFVCLFSLATLAGCASQIKTYDSTFTALLPKQSGNSHSLKYTSAYAGANYKLSKPKSRLKRPYFIEFRARNALTYGHAFVMFGELDKNGKVPVDAKGVVIPGAIEISGLHPASNSTVPWTIGHIVPVPAETGPSDGDFEEAYATARYRINLTEKEFRKVVAVVRKHKVQGTFWHGPLYACVNYINAIAKDLGLKVPRRPHLPKKYVNELKRLNGKNKRIAI